MTMLVLELLLRGAAMGALIATAAGTWRAAPGTPVAVAALGLCVSVMGYAIESSATARGALGVAGGIANLLSLSGSGFVWLFIVTLFGDRRITWANLAPAAFLTAFGVFGWAMPTRDAAETVFALHHLVQAALAAHALTVIVRSWQGDLVEARRSVRGPFLALVAVFVITLATIQFSERFGLVVPNGDLIAATALAFYCLAGAALFLQARAALFDEAAIPSRAVAQEPPLADRADLAKLDAAMGAGEIWRREGLTIGALGEEIGVPEHRLRRLINDNLGHRNFAAFINARRIEAAKTLLRDPAKARTPVSAIAFELGFGSLGPFNRAFKESVGVTPTEWRRDEGQNRSPIPEISG